MPDLPQKIFGNPPWYALRELHSLLAQGVSVWLFGTDYPAIPELSIDATLDSPPQPSIELYLRLGLEIIRQLTLTRMSSD